MNKVRFFPIIGIFAIIFLGFTFCTKKKKDKMFLFIGLSALNASKSTGTTAVTSPSFSISGTVSDLYTSGLILQNNASDDTSITVNPNSFSADFTFAKQVTGSYSVTIKTQPTAGSCTLTNNTGTALTNVTNVAAACITTIGGGVLKSLSSLAGIVTVFAGPANGTTTNSDTDGTGTSARFNAPGEITTDGTNLYVADTFNQKIRKIVISSGAVTTLAGPAQGSTTAGDTDGTGNGVRFTAPAGITTDGTNLYVGDMNNNKIRKIVISTGAVTTLAGPAQGSSATGDSDGTGTAARFNGPGGITTDGINLYVTDFGNNKIRKIVISTGAVTTLAGPAQGSTTPGDTDGTGNAARFDGPRPITTDGINLYLGDHNNNKIRKIVIATGVVTTLAGPAQGSNTSGDLDGTGTAARFQRPFGITTDGRNLYLCDSFNQKIRKIVIATGAVTTLAGPAQGSTTFGDLDGTGTSARFASPYGITWDGTNLYVADQGNHKIRRIQ